MSRVALFLPSLSGGGAERVMLTLAGEFASRGLEVDLVCCCVDGALSAEVPDGVATVDLAARRLAISPLALSRYLGSRRPDAMLSAMAPANLAAIAARALARSETRLVLSEHTPLAHAAARTRDPRLRIMPALARRLYPHSDGIVCVSEGVARDVSGLLATDHVDVSVIPNPVVTDRLSKLSRAPVGHPLARGEGPLLVSAGRLIPAKDFGTLIRAVARLRQRLPVRLVILGEGPERPRLEALIASKGLEGAVHLPGFFANPFSWFTASDLFVLSSRWEGFALVLVEALACGARVVSTDCPTGPREVLEGGRLGHLVAVGDDAALAAAMAQALEAPPRAPPDLSRYEARRVASRYLQVLGIG